MCNRNAGSLTIAAGCWTLDKKTGMLIQRHRNIAQYQGIDRMEAVLTAERIREQNVSLLSRESIGLHILFTTHEVL